jgi:uncharacterized membrane protein
VSLPIERRYRTAALTMPVIAVISVAASAAIWLDVPPMVRIPIGLLAVLILPGLSLSAALFPGFLHFDNVERLGLSFVLSLALITFIALSRDYWPIELGFAPLVVTLTAVTMLCSIVAGWRIWRAPSPGATNVYTWQETRPRARFGWAPLLGLILACGLGVGAIALMLASSRPGLTELYVLGASGQARDYPRAAQPGEPITLTIGIANRESASARYRVRVHSNGTPLASVGPVEIAANEVWNAPIDVTLTGLGRDREIGVLLFKDDAPEVYRELRLWVDVPRDAQG